LYPVTSAQTAAEANSTFLTDADAYEEDAWGQRVVRQRLNRLGRKFGVEPIKNNEHEGEITGLLVGEIGAIQLEGSRRGMIRIPAVRKATYEHPWWGTLYFDDDLFESFIDNWQTDVIGFELALDPSHEPEDGALAWIKDLAVEEEDGFVLYVEPTRKGKEVLGDVYRYCSIEYRENYVDRETGVEYGPTLMGAAATNRPFVHRQSPMTILHDPSMMTEPCEGVNCVFVPEIGEAAPKEDEVNLEPEGFDDLDQGVTLENGTEVVSLSDTPDPGESESAEPVAETPAETQPIAEVEMTEQVEVPEVQEPETVEATGVQVGGVTLDSATVQSLIEENARLKADAKAGAISAICDKALARGVPPVIAEVARQVLAGLEPEAEPTLSLTEPGEDGQERSLNLFNAIGVLLDSVPGRLGETTYLVSEETPPVEQQNSNPYAESTVKTTEEAEELARQKRKELGIQSPGQQTVAV
jgi:hypothetical protein